MKSCVCVLQSHSWRGLWQGCSANRGFTCRWNQMEALMGPKMRTVTIVSTHTHIHTRIFCSVIIFIIPFHLFLHCDIETSSFVWVSVWAYVWLVEFPLCPLSEEIWAEIQKGNWRSGALKVRKVTRTSTSQGQLWPLTLDLWPMRTGSAKMHAQWEKHLHTPHQAEKHLVVVYRGIQMHPRMLALSVRFTLASPAGFALLLLCCSNTGFSNFLQIIRAPVYSAAKNPLLFLPERKRRERERFRPLGILI